MTTPVHWGYWEPLPARHPILDDRPAVEAYLARQLRDSYEAAGYEAAPGQLPEFTILRSADVPAEQFIRNEAVIRAEVRVVPRPSTERRRRVRAAASAPFRLLWRGLCAVGRGIAHVLYALLEAL